jgi:Xaa-Pro aminopeptidase
LYNNSYPGLLLDIAGVQETLAAERLDGWLIYDFHGLNAVARELFVFNSHIVTRRWFYFIPAVGEPVLLAHKIEKTNFPKLPGQMFFYAGWRELHKQLQKLIRLAVRQKGVKKGAKPSTRRPRVAMEYSPMNDIPTVSYVDAGILELVRSLGVEVVSSANLVQIFQARWNVEQLASHIAAANVLFQAQQRAFEKIKTALRNGQPINEYEVQQFILQEIRAGGCITENAPIVAVNANASNPHYAPTAKAFSPIRKGDVILLDLWAKSPSPKAVFADITWMGYAGRNVPDKVQQAFQTVVTARDLAVSFLRQKSGSGKPVLGYQVDEVVRRHIKAAGYGDYFFHRTGHSLGIQLHANGVNIDSYETRDSRQIIPGLAFSVEPGIYLTEFGVRSEINVYFGDNGPEVHTQPQTELITLDV